MADDVHLDIVRVVNPDQEKTFFDTHRKRDVLKRPTPERALGAVTDNVVGRVRSPRAREIALTIPGCELRWKN